MWWVLIDTFALVFTRKAKHLLFSSCTCDNRNRNRSEAHTCFKERQTVALVSAHVFKDGHTVSRTKKMG